ncbi:MAG: cobalt-precorrin-6A reductase [Acaryochloris sp. RU_4_1]|nr:cobalt-precorrin-6A reductase [Acaryochloris sp. SU_5_25]NJM64363.1 cobalt-precorrin-6A reductase [Acaryochloris sp. RU_4_1]NJR55473.1 cobalt-precorrin-6A reductase [Acaryochloris sp. CRU_2_0]
MQQWTKQKQVLVLGGTREATPLAAQAADIPGVKVITALAGRTRQPMMPSVNTRIGSFGGIAGLTHYLREQEINVLIDATHPFAAQISLNAIAAATAVGIPHLMLIRPAWQRTADDHWIEVENNAAAAAVLPSIAQRILLTIGRQELATFAYLQDLWFLMRMIDSPPADARIPPGKLLRERGPFSLDHERSLLQVYEIDAIVSKNSGGEATYAKIIAARELQIPVVMVQRPSIPCGNKVADIESALSWLKKTIAFKPN